MICLRLASRTGSTATTKQSRIYKKQVGEVTRQVMPFDHSGCKYSKSDHGYQRNQTHFAEKLSEAVIARDAWMMSRSLAKN